MPYKDGVPKEKQKLYNRRYRDKHPDLHERKKLMPSYLIRYSRATDDAMNAHWQVYKAISKGDLIRPTTCSNCKKDNGLIEASHLDYSQPLDVVWLCRSCHRQMDFNKPRLGTTKEPFRQRKPAMSTEERRRRNAARMRKQRAQSKKEE